MNHFLDNSGYVGQNPTYLLFGQMIPIRAEIVQIENIAAHADSKKC